jgi:hypothetical protein
MLYRSEEANNSKELKKLEEFDIIKLQMTIEKDEEGWVTKNEWIWME